MISINLSGKCGLVTGGTRGIGRRISLTLASAGAQVAAFYRGDNNQAEATLREIGSANTHGQHQVYQADITNRDVVNDTVVRVGERFGGLDFLVLNAASGAGGSMVDMDADGWMKPFEVNVHGAFNVVKAAAPYLNDGASIVFISSGAGHDPMSGLSSYGASKAAVNHMAAVLAQELGPQKHIRVNVVSPGHTYKGDDDPNFNPEVWSQSQREIASTTALRRLGTSVDVANTVLFFCSDLSSFVTGQFLRVNGGRL